MRRIPTNNPELLVYREPVGWGVLFTVPIFLSVVGFGLSMLSLYGQELAGLPAWGLLIAGAVVLFIGYKVITWAVTWFGRVGVTIDRARGEVVAKWGFFLPIPYETQPLADWVGLLIGERVTIHYRNGHESYREYQYLLFLLGPGGRRLRLGRSEEYALVRAMAEDVGRFLTLPVVDGTRDEPVVLRPETLGLSLKEKAKLERPREVAPPPAGLQSKYRVEGDRIIIELPRVAWAGCLVTWFLLLLALVGLLIYLFVDSKGNWAVIAMWAAIGGVPLAILYAAVRPQQTILEVSPQGLEVADRGLIFTSRRRFAADRIRELRLEPVGIEVITDRERVTLATLVRGKERRWIHGVLQQVLAA
jgi:hypothetical protein